MRRSGFAYWLSTTTPTLGIRLAQPLGGLDPLVGVARRHADVGDDDVRPFGLDRGEERIEIAARGHDLQVGLRLEQTPETLTDEVVILGEHEPDRHGRGYGDAVSISRRGSVVRDEAPARPDRR